MRAFLISIMVFSQAAPAAEEQFQLENYAISSILYSSTRAKALVGVVDRARPRTSFAECNVNRVNDMDSAIHPYDLSSCTLVANRWIDTSEASIVRFNNMFVAEIYSLYSSNENYVRLKLMFRDGGALAAWTIANVFITKYTLRPMIDRGFYGGRLAGAGYLLGLINGLGVGYLAYAAYRDFQQPLPSLESKVMRELEGFAKAATKPPFSAKQALRETAHLYDLIVQAIERALTEASSA